MIHLAHDWVLTAVVAAVFGLAGALSVWVFATEPAPPPPPSDATVIVEPLANTPDAFLPPVEVAPPPMVAAPPPPPVVAAPPQSEPAPPQGGTKSTDGSAESITDTLHIAVNRTTDEKIDDLESILRDQKARAELLEQKLIELERRGKK